MVAIFTSKQSQKVPCISLIQEEAYSKLDIKDATRSRLVFIEFIPEFLGTHSHMCG